MIATGCISKSDRQFQLFDVDCRQCTVSFDAGEVVTDAGLLPIRQLDLQLGVLQGAAAVLADPRSAQFCTYSTEQVLTQTIYQLLGGYFDCNDANTLRYDPVLQVLVGKVPGSDDATLASGSTLARFRYGFTRRQAQLSVEERTIEQECQTAKCERIRKLNRYFVELFVKTRSTPPTRITLDFDATDDPTHGSQQLSLFHGYYKQHQYLPLLVFEGETKFPLAGWLRSGTAHASWGAIDTLRELTETLRAAWPGVEILVRADAGYAIPELYTFCEENGLKYVIGYSSNNVLKSKSQILMNYVQACATMYDEPMQRFQDIRDYQAESWDHPRRVIAKCEVTAQGGVNRRFVITNLEECPKHIYCNVYVQRGDSPERAIQELKHGLSLDRLSSHRFLANAFAMQCHLLAYALFVLFREANAAVPEVAQHTLETVRSKLLKIGAVVQTSARKVWFHASATWPGQGLFVRVCDAVQSFAERLRQLWAEKLIAAQTIKLGNPATLTK